MRERGKCGSFLPLAQETVPPQIDSVAAGSPGRPAAAIGALILASCFWGTGFFFGKIAFAEMSVMQDITWRFLLASLIFLPVLLRFRSRFSAKDWGLLILLSIISVPIQFLVQYQGLKFSTVSHASLMVGCLPVLVALGSAVVLRERMSRTEWGMLLASVAGAAAIALSDGKVAPGTRSTLLGDALVFASLVAATAMILLSKVLMERHSPLLITSWMIVLGTIFLVIPMGFAGGFHLHYSAGVWGAVAAQSVIASAGAFLLWNWGLERVPASRAGVFLNLEPIVGVVLGVGFLEERLGWAAIAGGAMILASAVYFSGKDRV